MTYRGWAPPPPRVCPVRVTAETTDSSASAPHATGRVQHELPTLMRLATSGRIDPSVVVTHTMDLAEGPDADALFASRAEGVGKILLRA